MLHSHHQGNGQWWKPLHIMFDSLWGAQSHDSADNHKLQQTNKKQTKKKEKKKQRGIEPIFSAYQPNASALPLGQNGPPCASVVWLCKVCSPQIVSAMDTPVYHIVTSWFAALRPVYLIIACRPLIKKYMDSGWTIKSVDQTEANSPPCWRVQLISCRLFGEGF